MIVDIHTHLWSNPEQLGTSSAERLRACRVDQSGARDGSPGAHERAMSCVDGSLIFGFRSELLGACVPNELIADFVAKESEHRIGVAGIDPMAEDAGDQMDIATGLGMAGVTISPVLQGFHPTHSSAMGVYERCCRDGLPLFVTLDHPLTREARLEFGRPILWDEVARSFPELRLVIGQLGHPWVEETILMLEKHENVFADLAGLAERPWPAYNALLNAASAGVMDKLLFGSGFPRTTPAKAIETLYSMNAYSQATPLPSISRSLIRGIVERDPLPLLGIDAELSGIQAENHGNRPSMPHAPNPMSISELSGAIS